MYVYVCMYIYVCMYDLVSVSFYCPVLENIGPMLPSSHDSPASEAPIVHT